jgi:Tol biopolymer transport system component
VTAVNLNRRQVYLFELAHPEKLEAVPTIPGRQDLSYASGWRPDSRAFAVRAGTGAVGDGYLYELETRTWTRIAPDVDDEIAFLPDGKRIVYASHGQLVLREIATGRTKVLIPAGDDHVTQPDLSPKGDQLVFVRSSWPADIWLATLKREQVQ